MALMSRSHPADEEEGDSPSLVLSFKAMDAKAGPVYENLVLQSLVILGLSSSPTIVI